MNALKNILLSELQTSPKGFENYLEIQKNIYASLIFDTKKTSKDIQAFIEQDPVNFPFLFLGKSVANTLAFISCADKEKIELSFNYAMEYYDQAYQKKSELLYGFSFSIHGERHFSEFSVFDLAYFLQLSGCEKPLQMLIEKDAIYSFTPSLNTMSYLLNSVSENQTVAELENRIEAGIDNLFASKYLMKDFFSKKTQEDLPYNFGSMYQYTSYTVEREYKEIFKDKKTTIPSYLVAASMVCARRQNNSQNQSYNVFNEEKQVVYLKGLEKLYDKAPEAHKKDIKELVAFVMFQDTRFDKLNMSSPDIQKILASWSIKGLFDLNASFKKTQTHALTKISMFSADNYERRTAGAETWYGNKFKKSELQSFIALCEKKALESTIASVDTPKKKEATFKL